MKKTLLSIFIICLISIVCFLSLGNISLTTSYYQQMNSFISIPWDISNAVYGNKNFNISSQVPSPRAFFFSSDGTKTYVSSSSVVYQYSLSTAWDVSTASYDNKSFDVSTQSPNVSGVFFKSDGTKMYTISLDNDSVYQYSLSTAWDVSTASYDNKVISVGIDGIDGNGIAFSSDGTKMFPSSSITIYQYSLSTAWDVSTAVIDSGSFSPTNGARSFFFKSDGSKLYYDVGNFDGIVYQYSLSTAWDVSTASYDNKSFDHSSESITSADLFFRPNGSNFYVNSSNTVYQYKL